MDDDEDVEDDKERIKENESTAELLSKIATFLDKTFAISFSVLPPQRLYAKDDAVNALKTHELFYPFQCKTVPPLDVKSYLCRIKQYGQCSDEAIFVGSLYVLRLSQKYGPSFPITVWSIHRILITCILLAVKFVDDVRWNNEYYSVVGGIPLTEMNALEVDMLALLEFNLYVTDDEYRIALTALTQK